MREGIVKTHFPPLLGAWAAACTACVALAQPVPEGFSQQPAGSLACWIEPLAAGAGPLGLNRPARLRTICGGRAWAIEAELPTGPASLASAGQAAQDREITLLAWRLRLGAEDDARHYGLLAHRDDVWYGSTYWAGPDWTRVGKDWQHPGQNTAAVRRFDVPRNGRVAISGRVAKYHADPKTDGVRVAIRHNGREIWRAELGGGDAQGIEPQLALDVRQGDRLRFVVHKRGEIYCDTTRWDPVIRYEDGETFRASAAFSASQQGHGGWFYEMETRATDAGGLPRLFALHKDLTLCEARLGQGARAVFDDNHHWPMLVLADASDQNGIALAMPPVATWRFSCQVTPQGHLELLWRARGGSPREGGSNAPARDPPWRAPIVVLCYQGTWLHGLMALEAVVSNPEAKELRPLSEALDAALWRAAAVGGEDPAAARLPQRALWLLVQAEWRREDRIDETPGTYHAAALKHLEKARTLCRDLRRGQPSGFLAAEAAELARLDTALAGPVPDVPSARDLWRRVRSLKRRMMLANPLVDSGQLLFCKRVPTSYSHLVMQYFGWRARPGGGLFVLEQPGWSLACRDITDGRLADGNVLEPRLSYDARRIVFSFVRPESPSLDPGRLANDQDQGFYHLFVVNVDGTGLRQITAGPYDDLMPAWLPDGGIVFSSTRRRGYARCFGPQFSKRWHVYTLHRVEADGSNLSTLSYHDTNEWFPTVAHNGLIVYARWDYIDRDAVTHQNLWTTRPDGTNPAALWGNATPKPHCTFQAQAVPGSHKFLATASAHHSITAGSIVLVDPCVARDGLEAITRITPEVPFPEAEGMNVREYYASPWPLSERYYLVAYSPRPLVWEPGANEPAALGLYLLDWQGDRELLYRDLDIGCESPCPLVARPVPPVLPSAASADTETSRPATGKPAVLGCPDPQAVAHQGRRPQAEGFRREVPEDAPRQTSGRQGAGQGQASASAPLPAQPQADSADSGQLILIDVYQGLGNVPRGHIRELRIVQILPKTTHVASQPPVGLAGEENGRAILGTVPVEADGSARFMVPARRPLLFQALDAEGFAWQTMRSVTYVQPGETTACVGCHEPRMSAPVRPNALPLALRRRASVIEPGPWGGRPFGFVEVVQPVLDRHCIACHGHPAPDNKGLQSPLDLTGTPEGPFSRSYLSLCKDRDFWGAGTNPKNAAEALVPRFGARNQIQTTPPGGQYGALSSRLIRLLRQGHYGVQLAPDDYRRLAAWIDLNAIFYGVYRPEHQAQQLRGQPVPMPEIQ